MKTIRNLLNKQLVFTLNDKSTLRLFPLEAKLLEEHLVSPEVQQAEIQGMLSFEEVAETKKPEETPVVIEEVPVKQEEPKKTVKKTK